jgi:hypothetical protein
MHVDYEKFKLKVPFEMSAWAVFFNVHNFISDLEVRGWKRNRFLQKNLWKLTVKIHPPEKVVKIDSENP